MVKLRYACLPACLRQYQRQAAFMPLQWHLSMVGRKNFTRPRQDSNLQSSDPKSDALSIRPRGRRYNTTFSPPITHHNYYSLPLDAFMLLLYLLLHRRCHRRQQPYSTGSRGHLVTVSYFIATHHLAQHSAS